ncbi:MAG TPA: hypothetical protein VGG22_09580 [Candidatus Baltobacteraceae bacterium]
MRSIAEVTSFYDVLMPAECIILFEEPAHRATETVLAFYAATYDEVDAVAKAMKAADLSVEEGPQRYPEYSERITRRSSAIRAATVSKSSAADPPCHPPKSCPRTS